MVRFIDVQKTFDGRSLVVEHLNLNVVRGEFLTLLGPSGSGKTTTLMMLAGFEPLSGGDIELDGRGISALPPHKREIGIVFQSYALFPHKTVGQNLSFPLRVRGLPRSKIVEEVTAALAMIRLPGFQDRRPYQLSGGQQQRIAVARALIFRPKLLLMDEPLGALDKHLREEMQVEIKRIHTEVGVTIIYVTHDQQEALKMSDRVAVFNKGRVEQIGTPYELYREPATAFVASFVGESNSLSGRIEKINGTECRVALDNGRSLLACQAAGVALGERVVVSVRPEHVLVGSIAESATNRFQVLVQQVTYSGDHRSVRVRLEDHDDFTFKLFGDEFEIGPGDRVEIGLEQRYCRALPVACP